MGASAGGMETVCAPGVGAAIEPPGSNPEKEQSKTPKSSQRATGESGSGGIQLMLPLPQGKPTLKNSRTAPKPDLFHYERIEYAGAGWTD